MQKFIIKISREDQTLIEDKAIECFLLDASLPENFIKTFAAKASSEDKITLIQGDGAVNICKKLNLDGIVVDLSKSEKIKKDVAEIKKALPGKILGLISRTRRHEAMVVSEEEPDFVIFKAWSEGLENTKELVSWYNEFFLIQSAVMLEDEINPGEITADIIITTDARYKKVLAK